MTSPHPDATGQASPEGTTLRPCPFCGESNVDFSGGDYDVSAQCEGCLASGPVATIGCRTEEDGDIDLEREAAELWNKRTLGAVK